MASPASALASSGNGRAYCFNDLTHQIDVMNEEGLERTLTLDFGEEDAERRMAFVKLLEEKKNDFQGFGKMRHVSVFSVVGTVDYLLFSAFEPLSAFMAKRCGMNRWIMTLMEVCLFAISREKVINFMAM